MGNFLDTNSNTKNISNLKNNVYNKNQIDNKFDSELDNYLRNDITVAGSVKIPNNKWYGEQGVGKCFMSALDSVGIPFDTYMTLNKIGARDQQLGSSWIAIPYNLYATDTQDIYIGSTPDTTRAPKFNKMLHEGCDTLESQLPETATNLLFENLNNIVHPCIRFQNLNDNAALELNYPFQTAGSLECLISANILQRYTSYRSPFNVARRTYYAYSWSIWIVDGATSLQTQYLTYYKNNLHLVSPYKPDDMNNTIKCRSGLSYGKSKSVRKDQNIQYYNYLEMLNIIKKDVKYYGKKYNDDLISLTKEDSAAMSQLKINFDEDIVTSSIIDFSNGTRVKVNKETFYPLFAWFFNERNKFFV